MGRLADLFGGGDGQTDAITFSYSGLAAIFIVVRENGIHDYVQVSEDVAASEQVNAKLKARNEQLFAEIGDLNDGLEAIEERGRSELGMIKPGESFYGSCPKTDTAECAVTKSQ